MSNQSYIVISSLISSLANQDSAFWTSLTVQIWSLHLHEDGPIRDHNIGCFILQASNVSQLPSGSESVFPFPQKTAFFQLELKHQRLNTENISRNWDGEKQAEQDTADQHRVKWCRAGKAELCSWRRTLPQGCLTPRPPLSHTIPQPCYFMTALVPRIMTIIRQGQ